MKYVDKEDVSWDRMWEKKEMNVEKAKEKAQINNLSKFSDNQIH